MLGSPDGAIETGKEDDSSSSPLSLSHLGTLRPAQGVGLLKGRSKEGPENRVLGSLWSPSSSAFGHLRVKPLSPFLAPRDGSRILHEAQVGGGQKSGRS